MACFYEDHARDLLGVGPDWHISMWHYLDWKRFGFGHPDGRLRVSGAVAPVDADGCVDWKLEDMLRREGVRVHMRYVCCDQCGTPSTPVFCSFVYYLREHERDFKEIGVLPIFFSSYDDDHIGAHALGDQVRIALELSGLTVEWSGDPDHPILVMA